MKQEEKFIKEMIKSLKAIQKENKEIVKKINAIDFEKMKNVDIMEQLKGKKRVFSNETEKEKYNKKMLEKEEKKYKEDKDPTPSSIKDLASKLGEKDKEIEIKTTGMFDKLKNMFVSLKSVKNSDTEKAKESEKEEKQIKTTEEFQNSNISYLSAIASYLKPEQEMLKGGDFKLPDFLGKLIPKSLRGIGGKFMKLAGGAMILGGIAWMLSDFIDGFKEGGIGGGLIRALTGKLDGTMESAFKNAGKFALIGAGIGSIFPVVGTIVGGLIGASIGLLFNVIGSLIKSEGSLKSKLSSFFFGGDGGIMSSIFNGSKFAAMGALIGSVFPVVGTIVGGLIGFAIGFLFNFVKQMLPNNIKEGIGNIFDKVVGWLKGAWEYVTSSLPSIFEVAGKILNSIGNFLLDIGNEIKQVFNNVIEYLGLDEYVKPIIEGVQKIFNWVGDVWDNLSNAISNIWSIAKKKLSSWFSFGGGDEKPKTKTKSSGGMLDNITNNIKIPSFRSEAEQKMSQSQEKMNEKQTKMVKKTGMLESIGNQMLEHVKSMEVFFKEQYFEKMQDVLLKTTETLYTNLRIMNEENRQMKYFSATGSLEGYGNQYQRFSEELKDLMNNDTEKEKINNSIANVMNDNKSNVNTIINTSSDSYKLRNK